jgi:hypothetical protein
MLNEKALLERAFQALDELAGPDVPETSPERLESAAVASSLKGRVVELWSDLAGGRAFVVADEEDAQNATRKVGARRGEIWTPAETGAIAGICDESIGREIAVFKRTLDGRLSARHTR